MSAALVLTVLAATLPIAAVGWAAATLADGLKVDAQTRGRLWLAALIAPLALAPALPLAWAAHALSPVRPVAASPAPAAAARPQTRPAVVVMAQRAPTAPSPYANLLVALLAGGAAIRLGLFGARLARASRLRAGALRTESPIQRDELRRQAARLGMRPPALRLWDGSQPVLVGLRRPIILLPRRLAEELDQTRLGLVLAHELGHLRARDPWRMAAAELAGAMMWFNPFSRASQTALSQVREEICDALALKGADRSTRRAYAETLLIALRERAGVSPALAFTGARRAARRMTSILHPSPESPGRAALCAGGAALALMVSLGGAAYAAAGVLPPPMPRQSGLSTAVSQAREVLIRAEALYRRGLVACSARAAALAAAAQQVSTSPGLEASVPPTAQIPAQANPAQRVPSADEAAQLSSPPALNTLAGPLAGDQTVATIAQLDPATASATERPSAPAVETPSLAAAVLPPAVYTAADWSSQPTFSQTRYVYPPRALMDAKAGVATLSCLVDVKGRVSGCRAVSELPRGLGFGDAAVKMQSLFRMTPKTVDGQPVSGTVIIPVDFAPFIATPLDPPAPKRAAK